jgi:hypothetical protein
VVENLDLLVDTSGGVNGRVAHHWWDDVKEWWGENKKCIAGMIGGAIGGGLAGCATGVGFVAAKAVIAGSTPVGAVAASAIVWNACYYTGLVGAVGGALLVYKTC